MRTSTAACLALLLAMGALFAGEELQRVHPKGSAAMIDKLDVSEIEKIELLKLDWFKNVIDESDPTLARRVYVEAPLLPGEEKSEQTAALLKLIKDAPAFVEWSKYEPLSSDSVIVFHLKSGKTFEIWYNSTLKEPFAGRHSLALKEALWSLSHNGPKISIIHIKDGKVQRTIHETGIAPHRGSVASGTSTVELHLTPEKGLTLYLKLTAAEDFSKAMENRKVEMEDEQPLHYGESTVYKSGADTYVVLVEQGSL